MNYKQFLHIKDLVRIGEEINFDYNGEEYWISHTPEGRCHLTRVSDSYTQTFNDVEALFNNAKIDNNIIGTIYPDIPWEY